MDIRPLLIAHTQSAELVEPSKGSFDDPAPSAQSTAMLGISLGEPRHDVTGTQTLADCLGVITPVAYHAIGTMARTASLSLQEWDGINQCECSLRIITICPGELNGQRNSAPVADQVALAAEFGPVGGIGTGLKPPKTARIEQLSRAARDQSICP